MAYEKMFEIIGSALVLVIVAVLIIALFWVASKNKDECVEQSEPDESENKNLDGDGDTVTTRAEIIDMNCGVYTVGYRTPKAVKSFIIKFKGEDETEYTVNVSEEVYCELDVGLVGILTLIDGQLNSFEID